MGLSGSWRSGIADSTVSITASKWWLAVDKTIRRRAPDWTGADGQRHTPFVPLVAAAVPLVSPMVPVGGVGSGNRRRAVARAIRDKERGSRCRERFGNWKCKNTKTQAGSRCRWNISSRRLVPSAPPSVSDSVRVFFRGTCNRSNRPRSGTHKEDLEPRINLMAL